MKTSIRIIFLMALSIALVCVSTIGQEKSDFTTVQQFQANVKTIEASIDNAKTSQDCADIGASIARLETTFSGDRELLDKTLYPDDYGKVVEKLRAKLALRQHDLGMIDSQGVHIAELEAKIKELSDQLTKLNTDNEKLMDDIKRLSSNIQKLTGNDFNAATPIDSLRALVVQLREGLKQRDQLVYALADSLFLQYDKNISDMKDVEKQGLAGKLERHGILPTVKRSIQDNLAFLESTQLKGVDLVTLVRQQQQFASQWKGLSPKISTLYATKSAVKGKPGKSSASETASVDSLLMIWGKKVDAALWRSLNQLFRDHGFVVKDFGNGQEFVVNFSSFIEEQTQNTKQDDKNTRYKFYQNFEDGVWKGEFGVVWLPALVQTQKITADQKKDIEDKIAVWRASVQPGTSWVTYVLVLAGLCILGVVLVWALRKKSVPPESVA
jgi:cell division protein FtsB